MELYSLDFDLIVNLSSYSAGVKAKFFLQITFCPGHLLFLAAECLSSLLKSEEPSAVYKLEGLPPTSDEESTR